MREARRRDTVGAIHELPLQHGGESPEQDPGLPLGWTVAKIDDLAYLLRGVSYKKAEASSVPRPGLVPVLRATNINSELHFDGLVYVPRTRVKEEQWVRAGDIVIAMSSGSKRLVGKAAQANQDFAGGFGAFCGVIRPSPMLERKLIGYFFQSPGYRNVIAQLSLGVNINNLRRDHVESMMLPLPPLPEQRRIVAKIEELFSQLDAGVEALQKVKAQLQRYRQAVLKHAFEGKLTAEWREARRDELEPASALLERIEAEVGAIHELPLRRRRRTRRKKLPPLDTSELPELPEGWVWERLDTLAEVRGGVTKGRKLGDSRTVEVPYLRVANVQSGYLDLDVLKTIEIRAEELEKYSLKSGDVLFTEGGDRDKLGRGTVWRDEVSPCIHQNHIFAARLHSTHVSSEWISLASQVAYARDYFWAVARQTVNLASINQTLLRSFPIPLPSVAEQEQILSEIDLRTSTLEHLEDTVDESLKRAERLRQSILRRAFEGRLVPQDPSDEPAWRLLERIKAEKARQGSAKKAGGRSTRKRSPEVTQGRLL